MRDTRVPPRQAAIDIKNNEGKTALQVASEKKTDWKPTVKAIKSFQRLVYLEAKKATAAA